MKKIFVFMVVAAMFLLGGMLSVSAAETIVIDKSRAADGVVSVQYNEPLKKTIKVRVEHSAGVYDYVILDNDATALPLQLGAGTYKITVAENVSGTKFRVIKTDTVTVDKIDEKKLYTNSIQLINFNGKMVSIVELNKLVAAAKTDKEKIDIIYTFIITHFTYDFDKASKVKSSSTYIPAIDAVYAAKKGICYDYSSLFAAILRANGIPAKLQMGYYTKIEAYHAWNEVFMDGAWVIIDTTYDSQAREYKISYTMKKDAKDFKLLKQY